MRDLHILPKVRDSLSFLYIERARIEQDDKAIAILDETGRVPVPCASLAVLMLGPGTTITHAAIHTLADCGCSVVWAGEQGVRFYAQGMGETRSARNVLRQAQLCNDPTARLRVVERMYRIRFAEQISPSLSLQQIRGKEGIRVRETYARLSRETGAVWSGRSYNRGDWHAADPINRAVSAANSCLYGVCHAAIVSAGYSPSLGFLHTGKMLSFVYDIADLYKMELTVPITFRAVQASTDRLETRVRKASREAFQHGRLLQRVVTDIERVLFGSPESEVTDPVDSDLALPGSLRDPGDSVSGGVNYGGDKGDEH
jgi:CRISP-associated protein Cas1